MSWLEAMVLGAVQGLTEFLPISSDGHLSVVQKLFAKLEGYDRPAAENLFFFVMLHLGTLAAILVHYRGAIATGAKGLLGFPDTPPAFRRAEVVRMSFLALLATLPLVADKLLFMDWIEEAFRAPIYAGIGFLTTAAVLALTLRLRGGTRGPEETTWLDALLIGAAQMFAPLPGVSRSGLTVAAALARGFDRGWAVRFSLLIAVPAILGAAVSELTGVDPATLTIGRVVQTAAATAVSGVVGYLAIVWLIRAVRGNRLWVFSLYLVMAGIAVIAWSVAGGPSTDGERSRAMDRAVRVGADGSGPAGAAGERIGAVDRPRGEGA
jgi:undecaprenyl-diphosphatase